MPKSLDEWLTIRALERQLKELEGEYLPQLESAGEEHFQPILATWDFRSGWPEAYLGRLRTAKLVRRAEHCGINLHAEPDWWTRHDESGTSYLTNLGLVRARRLIRDDFRQSFKWWIDVIAPIVGALTGLVGALIGLTALRNQGP